MWALHWQQYYSKRLPQTSTTARGHLRLTANLSTIRQVHRHEPGYSPVIIRKPPKLYDLPNNINIFCISFPASQNGKTSIRGRAKRTDHKSQHPPQKLAVPVRAATTQRNYRRCGPWLCPSWALPRRQWRDAPSEHVSGSTRDGGLRSDTPAAATFRLPRGGAIGWCCGRNERAGVQKPKAGKEFV